MTWRPDLRSLSFGSTAAILTSMGLIAGLDAATATKGAVLGSLLIVALADNLTDSLSVHIYQESERLPERAAFRTTVMNFVARLCVSLTFVLMFWLLPTTVAVPVCLVWGFLLLVGLSWLLARDRAVAAWPEIWKHAAVAAVVIAISKAVGAGILALTPSA
jgi:hypothetical protein